MRGNFAWDNPNCITCTHYVLLEPRLRCRARETTTTNSRRKRGQPATRPIVKGSGRSRLVHLILYVVALKTSILLNGFSLQIQALPYKWKQELMELDIEVPVPKGTRGKDLNVVIQKKKLSVGLKGQEPIMGGELCKQIKIEESTWTLGT